VFVQGPREGRGVVKTITTFAQHSDGRSAHPRSQIKLPHSDIKMVSLTYLDRLSDCDARSWPEAYTAVAKLFKHREAEARG